MKKVYASEDRLMAGHIKNLLESNDMNCIMKNEHITCGAGEIPLNECWPEIWITDDSQYEVAKKIVKNALHGKAESGPSWKCPTCEEEHDHQFTECWSCGKSRV